jgi:hypothetical protein
MTSSGRQDTHKTRREFKSKGTKEKPDPGRSKGREDTNTQVRKRVGKKISEAAKVF